MLPYVLAIAVGASSSVLFLTAFFLKDIHRQDDFFWSGIGLFYALVLWFCATSITGAVLLGQLAAVALLLAYFWQVIKLRGAIANPEKIASLDNFSVISSLQNWLVRSPKTTIPQTVVDEKSDTIVQTEEKPSFPLTTVKKETVAEEKSDAIVETDETSINTQIASVSDTSTTSKSDLKDKTSAITAQSDTVTETPSQTPEGESTRLGEPDTEIAVESATIVEEETNWSDEDEVEIPVSSVKVVEEVPPSSNESQTTIEVADTPSEDRPTDKTDKEV